MEKQSKGQSTLKTKNPGILSYFLSLGNLFNKYAQTSSMLNASGTATNLFYYQGPGKNGKFKMNQRRERALSRRRNTKPSARN